MRKRILRGAAILGVLAVPFAVTAAFGAFHAGIYAGKITGVQGSTLPQGGNMKFKVSSTAKVRSFQASKVYVACADGNVHRTSFHWSGKAPIVKKNGHPIFTLTGSTGTANLKVKGIIRGSNHARGVLNFKGVMSTSGGTLNCKTGRQFWSAGHVAGT
jgi:hypothetical protein